MRGFVPFVAVAMAGCVNVLMIRQNELIKGIAVFDEFDCDFLLALIRRGKGLNTATRQLLDAMLLQSAASPESFGTSP